MLFDQFKGTNMNFRKTALALSVLGAVGMSGCGGSSHDHPQVSTSVEVFDGFGLGCAVSVNGVAAAELGGGSYSAVGTFSDGAVFSATGCTDADTDAKLPALSGVAQSGGVAISPITTLIVEAARAANPGADTATVSATDLTAASTAIVTNLGLGSYDPVNPATANYVTAAAAAPTSASGDVMKQAMAISTLLKASEVSAGAAAASAVAAVAEAVANSTSVIDLAVEGNVTQLMTDAAAVDAAVAAALAVASTAAAANVAAIANAADAGVAAAVTQAVAVVLNDATADNVADVAAVVPPTDPIDIGDTGETGGGSTGTGGTGGTGGI